MKLRLNPAIVGTALVAGLGLLAASAASTAGLAQTSAPPAPAAAPAVSPSTAPTSPLDDEAIRSRLAADGYQVSKIKRESRKIEVKAMREGRSYELYLDPKDGRVLKTEQED